MKFGTYNMCNTTQLHLDMQAMHPSLCQLSHGVSTILSIGPLPGDDFPGRSRSKLKLLFLWVQTVPIYLKNVARRSGSTRLYLSSGMQHRTISLTMTPTMKVAKLVNMLYHIKDTYEARDFVSLALALKNA